MGLMVPKQRPRAAESWAYAYQLNPPQPEPRFAKIKMLLRRARLAAQRAGRLWTGQVVKDAHITHILVVTDAPDGARAGVVAARHARQTRSEDIRSLGRPLARQLTRARRAPLTRRVSVGRRRPCGNARRSRAGCATSVSPECSGRETSRCRPRR